MSEQIKSCNTCEHRYWFFGRNCGRTGYACWIERQAPNSIGGCGSDFRGWAPRRGLIRRVVEFFKGHHA